MDSNLGPASRTRDMDPDDVFRSAQLVDPAVTRAAIAAYVSEIEQMSGELDGLDIDGFDGVTCFSPAWQNSGRQQ